ncbi:YgaP family membrane protein [Natrinema ejinorense]|uniref:Inner membrane protein YgaP-like transmembrane domain-containing protein n=1 Tax=Natrinema ejinorense TaxID=373386 RepID=A0A2A5QQ98_9EURY|nr:DUF2892 domain-containing protein [Natrinema ejinorense]PCR88955.1 hypothetical protein CP557_21005 [Natrinema ejinorense]
MEYNIGSTDRTVRAVAGAVLAAVGIAILGGALEFGTTLGGVALVIGVVFLGTALVRTCLLYRILGIDTSESA